MECIRIEERSRLGIHGALDRVVFCEESETMVNAINANGGNVRLTAYPENAHDAWDDTYGNPYMWAWLFAQKKETEPDTVETGNFDGKRFG